MNLYDAIIQTATAVGLLLVAGAGRASDAVLSTAAPVQPGDVASLGGGLVVVIAAIVLFGWFYSRTNGARGGDSDVIQVVASRSIGPKERIVLVEVADKQLVVGMTSTSVQTLHVFDEPVAHAAVPKSGFASRLREIMRGGDK